MSKFLYVGNLNKITKTNGPNCKIHPRDYKKWIDQQPDSCSIYANNPLLADLFPAKNIIVIYKNQQARLCEHPEWSEKGRYLSSGEFWSAVGEKWIKELK